MKKLSIAVVIASLFLASCSATNFLHKVKNKIMGTSETTQTAPDVDAPATPTTVTEPTTAPTTAAPSDTMIKTDVQVDATTKN